MFVKRVVRVTERSPKIDREADRKVRRLPKIDAPAGLGEIVRILHALRGKPRRHCKSRRSALWPGNEQQVGRAGIYRSNRLVALHAGIIKADPGPCTARTAEFERRRENAARLAAEERAFRHGKLKDTGGDVEFKLAIANGRLSQTDGHHRLTKRYSGAFVVKLVERIRKVLARLIEVPGDV